jgi:hypothetical protein
MCFGRTGWDKMKYSKSSQTRSSTARILNTLDEAKDKLDAEKRKGDESAKIIEKELKPFNYREMIPSLYDTIISALPNEKNNPAQAGLYQAFAKGDVEAIKEIPRKKRKQIFITNMEAFFSSDIASAQFGGADMFRRSRGMPGAGGEEYEGMEEYELMMEMEMMRGYGDYYPGDMFGMGQTTEEKFPGFIVAVSGYSPYGNITELLDPDERLVKDVQEKWGLVTRLMHLDDFVDGNSPFEVFKKNDPNQFSLDIGEISLEEQIPAGIGQTDIRSKPTPPGSTQTESWEWILVDPMTSETISKVAEWQDNGREKLDRMGKQLYTVNDHWFILNVKFVWRDAPESVKAKAPELPIYMRGGMMGRSATQPATTSPTGIE